MAIAFARVSIHSRSKGHSALAASSYRAGTSLHDERTGLVHDFSNRQDVVFSDILLPEGANQSFLDRQSLWNAVENAETRINSQICKDIVLALPKELNQAQQIELTKRFAKTHFVENGLPADIAIHDHGDGNPHVHILIPTRRLEVDRFSKYKARDLNPNFAKGLIVEKDYWSEKWRDFQNQYFKEQGLEFKVDLNHVVSERHRGRYRNQNNHYLKEENRLINKVRREIARGKVSAFIEHLSNQCSVFSRPQVEKLLFKTFKHSKDSQEYLRVLERILGHKQIIALGKNDKGLESFTTRKQYQLEAGLHKDVESLLNRKSSYDNKPLGSLVSQYTLSDEQSEALAHVIKSPDISVVIGRPGTGKSYLLKPVKDFYEQNQQTVIGASLSGKVAKALQNETGIGSQTIASLKYRLQKNQLSLSDKHVLVVDEAGMVDVDNMAFLIKEAKKANAKLVLLGDPDQLKPIHKGEIFRGISGITGYFELDNIKRQQNKADRQASRDMAKGDIQKAIHHYHKKGAIHLSNNASDDLIKDWQKSLESQKIEETVLLSFSRRAVAELNDKARDALLQKGKLGKENIAFQGLDRQLVISKGERLLFRQNNKTLGVRNGDMGTVKHVNQHEYQVRLDSGETITVPRKYQSVDYGYALTVHKSQGMTAKQVSVLIDNKYWDRSLSFVAFTRHKESLKIYSDKAHHASHEDLINTLSKNKVRDNVIDWPLDYATRCGFDPDKLIGRVVNHLAGVGHKIKQGYNYVVNYEAYLLDNDIQRRKQDKSTLQTQARQYAKALDANQSANKEINRHKNGSPSLHPQNVKSDIEILQKMLEKRKHLSGYYAERINKQIIGLAKAILANPDLISQLEKNKQILLKNINKYYHKSLLR